MQQSIALTLLFWTVAALITGIFIGKWLSRGNAQATSGTNDNILEITYLSDLGHKFRERRAKMELSQSEVNARLGRHSAHHLEHNRVRFDSFGKALSYARLLGVDKLIINIQKYQPNDNRQEREPIDGRSTGEPVGRSDEPTASDVFGKFED